MGLEWLATNCGKQDVCPAIGRIDEENVIFKGYEVTDPVILAGLNLSPGEIVGRLPAKLVLEAAARLEERV